MAGINVYHDHLSHCGPLFNGRGFVVDDHWYSQDCIMHEYSRSDVGSCLSILAAQNMSADVLSMLIHSQMQQTTLCNPLCQRMVLLNSLCNKLLRPMDTNCCLPRDDRSPAFMYILLILLICGCLFALVYLVWLVVLKKLGQAVPEVTEITPPWATEFVRAAKVFCVIIFILTYIYLADRVPLFGVMSKVGRSVWFIPLLMIVIALTLPAWRSSRDSSAVMSRSQTDETKGWMQCIILIYHYTGVSQMVSVYLFVRVLVATYLFLSGYGHFRFFWKTGDFGFKRFIQVLLRLNFSTVLVAMVMGTPYEQYYFVPLISFWFVLIFLFMFSWPRVTRSRLLDAHQRWKLVLYILLKFAISYIVIEFIASSQGRFEAIFSKWPLHWLFADRTGGLREWWFRVQLDRHAVLWGMFAAFVLCLCEEYNYEVLRLRKLLKMVLATLSVIVLASYGVFLWKCKSKVDCNLSHTRWSFLPIMAFFVLRNLTDAVRRVQNRSLQLIGTVALELFLCQFHIWLAFDTQGLLVVVWVSHVLNFLLVTAVFVCVSFALHYSTKEFITIVTASS